MQVTATRKKSALIGQQHELHVRFVRVRADLRVPEVDQRIADGAPLRDWMLSHQLSMCPACVARAIWANSSREHQQSQVPTVRAVECIGADARDQAARQRTFGR